MTDGPFNAAEIGISLGLALEAARLPYALGGALALGVWSLPRATKDVDLNLFVTPDRLDEAFDVLQAQGVALDRAEARRAATDEGLFIGWAGACRIDVFTPSIPFSWEALKTRKAVMLDGQNIWFLSAEALAFFKMMFFRGKDLVDLERLLSGGGASFDAAWVRRWLVDTVGDDDPRIQRWDDLCARFAPRG
ncbi:MAG: hypothetical protein SFW67_15400 [Myxococcaceae bacterium]|nr:hypothetical protein [Myxococcaceae bacterium]